MSTLLRGLFFISPKFQLSPSEGGEGPHRYPEQKESQKCSPEQEKAQQKMGKLLQEQGAVLVRKREAEDFEKQANLKLSEEKQKMAALLYGRLMVGQGVSQEKAAVVIGNIREAVNRDSSKKLFEQVKTHEGREELRVQFQIKEVHPSLSSSGQSDPTSPPDTRLQSPSQTGEVYEKSPSDNQSLSQVENEDDARERLSQALQNKEDEVSVAEQNYQEARFQVEQTQWEYDDWMRDYKDTAKIIDPTVQLEDTHGPTPGANTDISDPEFITRMERIERFLDDETGNANGVNIRADKDGQGYYLEGVSSFYDSSWKKEFQSRREAVRAKMRYELFDEVPLNSFLKQDASILERYKNDPEILSQWRKLNPDEPMNLKGFRRLLMVSIMKKFDPEGYGKMSYDMICKNKSKPIIEQFRSFREHKFQGIKQFGVNDIAECVKKMGAGNLSPQDMKWPPGTL